MADSDRDQRNGLKQLSQWLTLHGVQFVTLAFWALLLGLGRQVAVSSGISLEVMEISIRELLHIAFWGPLLLVILYAIRPLTLIPSSLLTILAGSIFGIFPGILYALLGGVISALVPYGLGCLSSRKTNPSPSKSEINLLSRILGEVHDHPFQAVFISRLLYPPYDLVNFLFGSLRIPLLSFVAGTFTGNIIGAFGYVGVGASVEGVITSGSLELNEGLLLMSLLVLVASLVVMLALRSRSSAKHQHPDHDVHADSG